MFILISHLVLSHFNISENCLATCVDIYPINALPQCHANSTHYFNPPINCVLTRTKVRYNVYTAPSCDVILAFSLSHTFSPEGGSCLSSACNVTSCKACYYSEGAPRSLPGGCEKYTCATKKNDITKLQKCMLNFGKCIRTRDRRLYGQV